MSPSDCFGCITGYEPLAPHRETRLQAAANTKDAEQHGPGNREAGQRNIPRGTFHVHSDGKESMFVKKSLSSGRLRRAVAVVMITAAAALWSSAGSLAAPLDQRDVAADAQWLAHIDFDAIFATDVAKKIYSSLLGSRVNQQNLLKLKAFTGIDLLKDFHGITFYAPRYAPESGVVIVRAKIDQQRVLMLLQYAIKHKTEIYNNHELHTWEDSENAAGPKTITGCFFKPSIVVIGQEIDEVKAALEVLDGRAPNLADSDSTLKHDTPEGTVFQAAATGLSDLDHAKLPFVSPVIRKSKTLLLLIGEHENDVFAQAQLVTTSLEVAQQIHDVLEGLRAMAELQRDVGPEALKIVKALRITATGKAVRVNWRVSSQEFLDIIQQTLLPQPQAKETSRNGKREPQNRYRRGQEGASSQSSQAVPTTACFG